MTDFSWADRARSRLASFSAERAAAQASYQNLSDRCRELKLNAQSLAQQAIDHRHAAAYVRGDNGPTLDRAERLQREAEAAERAYLDAERLRAAAEQRSRPVIHRANEARRILIDLGIINQGEAV